LPVGWATGPPAHGCVQKALVAECWKQIAVLLILAQALSDEMGERMSALQSSVQKPFAIPPPKVFEAAVTH
jgi:hypothetical protein